MMIQTKCQWCKRPFQFAVKTVDYKKWMNGTMVQAAFPYLDADDRELLISGTCGQCWAEMFADEELVPV